MVLSLGLAGDLPARDAEFAASGGLISLRVGSDLLLHSLGIVVVRPGWRGSYDAQTFEPSIGPLPSSPHRFPIRLKGDGIPINGELTVRLLKNGLSLSYRLSPEKSLAVETVMIRAFLPVTGNAGQTRWVAVSRQTGVVMTDTFPLSLPPSYHLLDRSDLDEVGWQLPSGKGLVISLDSGIASVTLQDDRQFGSDLFEIQFHLFRDRFRPGDHVQGQLTINVFSPSEFLGWEKKAKGSAEWYRNLFSQRAQPSLRLLRPIPKSLPCYETVEAELDLKGTYDNPFDTEQVRLDAEIRDPKGQVIIIPCFFNVPFRLQTRGDNETVLPDGKPHFAFRYTPCRTGTHTIRFIADIYDESLTKRKLVTPWHRLEVTPPKDRRGFLRLGSRWHLEHDDGTVFIPVGLNLCWSGNRLGPYRRWFQKMKEVGANFARIWLVPWNMGLEWKEGDGSGRYLGLGKYALDNAWRLDQLIWMAEANGVYLMLCLGYHGELTDQTLYFGEQAWERSPYNKANGGPCERPADFWTDPEAIRLYQQKLRYIIARTAHSPNVLAYEFWNEVNAPAHWIETMSQFFRQVDAYDHLLTTTYGDEAVWQLKEMDFVQTHWYGDGSHMDCSGTVKSLHIQFTEKFAKPFLLGEFGIDWRSTDTHYDPKGDAVHWHNGMWSSLLSRGMGTACVWYWDSYVDLLDLWRRFRPVGHFVKQVGPSWKRDWRIAQTDDPLFLDRQAEGLADLVFRPTLGWQKPTGDTFTVHTSGRIDGNGETSVFLFSPSKPDLYRPPRFWVHFPQDGSVVIRVHTISSNAVLIVRCDGKEVFRQPLPEGDLKTDEQGRQFREGSYKDRRWDRQWKKWDYIYDQDWRVAVPGGKHLIELDNQGADWCTIPHIIFSPYRDSRYAPVDIIGMQCDDQALLWVHHQESHFQNFRQGKIPDPLPDFQFKVTGLPHGRYSILYWDTWNGRALGEETKESDAGVLTVIVRGLQRDVALWIRKKDKKD